MPGPPEAWRAAGFAVGADGTSAIGGVTLRLGAPRFAWALTGLPDGADLDGLPLAPPPPGTMPAPEAVHPNAIVGIDHVVAFTPDLDRTTAKLTAAGLDLRRVREAGGGVRQAFFVLGPCLLELVGPVDGDVRLWGLTLVTSRIDGTAEALGDRLGPVKEAVQAGRRIATIRKDAMLGVACAVMTPRPD